MTIWTTFNDVRPKPIIRMNNYAITISLYLVIAINHVAWANNHPHSLTISESWTDNGGLYFDADFYQKIANEKKYVPDGRLSGYVDTLMTWGMIESSKPIQLFGGSYALTNEYAVSIVCVNHQFADYLTPSNSVWAVITNSMGHVVNSESYTIKARTGYIGKTSVQYWVTMAEWSFSRLSRTTLAQLGI